VLSVIMLSVVMLTVVVLSVIMLTVLAPNFVANFVLLQFSIRPIISRRMTRWAVTSTGSTSFPSSSSAPSSCSTLSLVSSAGKGAFTLTNKVVAKTQATVVKVEPFQDKMKTQLLTHFIFFVIYV
jgi:hypothetical protein